VAWRRMLRAMRLPCSSSACGCPTRRQSGNPPSSRGQDLQMANRCYIATSTILSGHNRRLPNLFLLNRYVSWLTGAWFFPRRPFGARGASASCWPLARSFDHVPAVLHKWQITGTGWRVAVPPAAFPAGATPLPSVRLAAARSTVSHAPSLSTRSSRPDRLPA
jgi:hypothetical protein